jgi:hypothetical protein
MADLKLSGAVQAAVAKIAGQGEDKVEETELARLAYRAFKDAKDEDEGLQALRALLKAVR